MEEEKSLKKHVDDFNKIIMDLKSVNMKTDDEDHAIILLSSLPNRFEHFFLHNVVWENISYDDRS